MFDLDQCIAECREALAEGDARQAVHDIVAHAVSDPAAILRAVGEPERAGLHRLHHTSELTVLNVVWGPYMTLMPHDHRMWAVIGVYTGAEDNIFWRRDGEALKAAGARALREGDVEQLGADAIHSVTNPVDRLTGAIHVYGGDFFGEPRSEWDPQSLTERAYDVERAMRLFEASNARLAEAAATA